jgi:hypothetical protein
MSARSDTRAGVVQFRGGFDGARGAALFEEMAEGRLIGRLSLRAGFSWFDDTPGGGPQIALKLDLLRQEGQGLDLALAAGFETQGFNLVPAATFAVAAARRTGDVTMLAVLAYSQGLSRGERSVQLHLSAVRPAGRRLHVGLDARLRRDLERDLTEPAGETEWDVAAGPTAVLSLGPLALFATAGISAAKLRATAGTHVGALLLIGVGTAF